MVRTIYVSAFLILFSIPAQAVEIDLPLYDYPYNQEAGYRAPSTTQALEISKGFYRLSHEAINRKVENPVRAKVYNLVFDLLANWLPLGDAWLHEEWHRAVMGRRDIDSYNEVYDFRIFSETIAVSHVRDQDLIALKASYPAEIVRLHAAGMEAQTELNFSIERDHFFDKPNRDDLLLLWLNYLNNSSYLYTCATTDSDSLTESFYPNEGTNIADRDFTGLDCNAWVYDLFRPDEPYTARGVHPSGVGVDRYITYSELTDEEKSYLRRNLRLSLVNFINPFLFGRHEFSKNELRWNITARHHLTSFGYNLAINLFIKHKGGRHLFTPHYYRNRGNGFFGIEWRWHQPGVRLPVGRLDEFRLAIWNQPRDQEFYTREADFGGMFSIRASHNMGANTRVYLQLSAKTAGWQAGNVYLDEQVELIGGLEWVFWQ